MLVGVPWVMGEEPGQQIAKVEANLANTGAALYCPRQAYVLVLCIFLAYMVSCPDFNYEAMPPCPTPPTHATGA